jgi:hypothetical protein
MYQNKIVDKWFEKIKLAATNRTKLSHLPYVLKCTKSASNKILHFPKALLRAYSYCEIENVTFTEIVFVYTIFLRNYLFTLYSKNL